MVWPGCTTVPLAGAEVLAKLTSESTTGWVTCEEQLASPGQRASPPPETAAVLVTSGRAAASTATTTVITSACAPAANAVDRVQVTLLPAVLQPQPVPVAVTSDNPAGRLSVTVIGPWVGAVPVLDTVRV